MLISLQIFTMNILGQRETDSTASWKSCKSPEIEPTSSSLYVIKVVFIIHVIVGSVGGHWMQLYKCEALLIISMPYSCNT